MRFIREWGIFILVIVLIILSRIFIWDVATVDGNSMDPTLGNGQRLIMLKGNSNIKRFDIVVAQETVDQTKLNSVDPSSVTKGTVIIKRVIGLPGDTIKYEDDTLYIKPAGASSFTKYDEPYLDAYQKLFANGQLADQYAKIPLTSTVTAAVRSNFVQLAKNTKAFTTDNSGNPNFTVTVPEGEYYLMGDDRVVSADSRKVGAFEKSQIIGKPFLRYWPLTKLGGI
ncbi:MAG: signal peptidase I [Streptococcaceae bacterium]|jgi:signal peptidase I|nr:signal peptidase I [Streptococcaceae bacterium]